MPLPAVLLAAALPILALMPAAPSASVPPRTSEAFIVQGVPEVRVDVRVDGKLIRRAMPVKAIVGPLAVSDGDHTVSFESSDWTVEASFDNSRRSIDIVLHWTVDPTEEPAVTVFVNDVKPVAAGKGRITVAHTAVVPPADVRVSGRVLFSNIANMEFVTAEVPTDTYPVDIVPTGGTSPLLGPVDLNVEAGALTRVFAYGMPENGSMDAIVQVLPLAERGSERPGSVSAGSAGLVATPATSGDNGGSPGPWGRTMIAVGAVLALILGSVLRRRHVRL